MNELSRNKITSIQVTKEKEILTAVSHTPLKTLILVISSHRFAEDFLLFNARTEPLFVMFLEGP